MSTRFLFKIDPFLKIKTYCNNKKRLVGSVYVLSYTFFWKNCQEKYGKDVRTVLENTKKSSFYHNWTVRLYHNFYRKDLPNSLTKIYKNLNFFDVKSLFWLFFSNLKLFNINGMTQRFFPMAEPFSLCAHEIQMRMYTSVRKMSFITGYIPPKHYIQCTIIILIMQKH